MVLYEAYEQGRESPLKALGVQYADFAMWQRRWLEGGALEQGLEYWKKRLKNLDLPLPISIFIPSQSYSADG